MKKTSDPSDASPVVEPGLFKFIDQPITFNDAKGNSRETILKWPKLMKTPCQFLTRSIRRQKRIYKRSYEINDSG